MKDDSSGPVTTVAAGIFKEVLDALEAVEGYEEIAKRMRSAVSTEKGFTELSIRAAIFGEDPK